MTRRTSVPGATGVDVELEVAQGLETIARDELSALVRREQISALTLHNGAVTARLAGELRPLLRLQTVQAAYTSAVYVVPRPQALLGHQHFTRLVAQARAAMDVGGAANFATLYLSAAGADTPVMTRLKTELAAALGLRVADDAGDLLVRLRRPRAAEGWEVLTRITPKPLATRAWRAANYPGALNAAVANAMTRLAPATPEDVVFNPLCGSGTLLIERHAHTPAELMAGCDTLGEALDAARLNLAAANMTGQVALYNWDATNTPLPTGSVDVLYSDLPFGSLTGSHASNIELYPALLREAARVARVGASFVLITHEVRLFERVLGAAAGWAVRGQWRTVLGGLHPRIYRLQRV